MLYQVFEFSPLLHLKVNINSMINLNTDSDINDFIIVRLDNEYFAFDVRDIAEVFPYTAPVRMPRAPKFLIGMIDIRGQMLPVVDLRLRAEIDSQTKPRHILAVRLEDRFIGAVVDQVCEVYSAKEDDIGDIATLGDKIDPQFVRRALRWGKRLVPVMDTNRLLTNDETLKLKHLRTPRRRHGEKAIN
jgi:purine-binding chemotaxis protein CheW